MSCVDGFRSLFEGVSLEADDLLLLESFQISYLPGWVPERELAAVLWAHPYIQRFLVRKHPPIAAFIDRVAGIVEDEAALDAVRAEVNEFSSGFSCPGLDHLVK